MNQPDLTAYALGELPPAEARQAAEYLAAHPEAALEMERLGLVITALGRLPEQEPPRRIAFVSDKVFEPAWYQKLWRSGPLAGLASAALLAVAILAHGVMANSGTARPALPVAAQAPSPQAIEEAIARQVDAEVSRRMQASLTTVRREFEAEKTRLVQAAIDQAERKYNLDRQAYQAAVSYEIDLMRKQMNRVLYLASNQTGGRQ